MDPQGNCLYGVGCILMHRESPSVYDVIEGVPIWVMLSRSVLIFQHT